MNSYTEVSLTFS